MGQKKRNLIRILGALAIILFLGFFLANYIVKSKIEEALKNKLPETVKLIYTDLDLSLFQGQLIINKIQLTNFGKTIQEPNAEVALEQIVIDGFSFWNFLVHNIIQVDDVYLKNPHVTYFHNATIPKDKYRVSDSNSFNNNIQIKAIRLDKGDFKVVDSETDSLKFHIEQIDLKFNGISYNEKTKTRKIPFEIESYQVVFGSFFGQVGDYENVTISHAEITDQATELKNIVFFTKYSKEELSRIIPFERDHYNLQIDSLVVEQTYLQVVKDSIWQFSSNNVSFYQPDFKVYRDKLVTDDERIKPLYSKMLRDLKFDLNIENVSIHDANISYSEKVKADKEAGTITFSDFQADIKHVSNTYQSPTKTTLHIQTQFMEHTPLNVVWSFDVNDETDLFEFQADIDNLQASNLNSFTEPNLNIRLQGQLDKTYFTISGTDETATIDFKMKYKYFNVIALKDDGKEKNQFLSDVINLFISKDSHSEVSNFKEAIKTDMERQKTQSVFNFIWISTRAGLLKAMTLN